MPVGWRKIKLASGVIYYEREQIPLKQFRWPVRLGHNVSKPTHDERFLRFRAIRGWLSIEPDISAGGAYFKGHDAKCFIPGPIKENSYQTIELIALYSRFHLGPAKTRYKIMWIERADNVCYRKGTGNVDADIWENLDLEEIDVVLGSATAASSVRCPLDS